MGDMRTVVLAGTGSDGPDAQNAPERNPKSVYISVSRGNWPLRDPLPGWPEAACPPDVPASQRSTRVLVVDDNSRTRAGLRALLLTTPGVKVVGEAPDGASAIRLAAALQPDVVLMDVRLPEVDGIEATRVIKSRQPSVRVVVLTISAAYRTEAVAAGADAFLVKGGPADELVAAVLDSDDPGPRSGRRKRRSNPRRPIPGHRPFGPCFGMPLT